MPKRKRLHELVDVLPNSEVKTAQRLLEALCLSAHADPVVRRLWTSPYDDEPETEEERQAVAEAHVDIRKGRVRPWEEVRRELAGG